MRQWKGIDMNPLSFSTIYFRFTLCLCVITLLCGWTKSHTNFTQQFMSSLRRVNIGYLQFSCLPSLFNLWESLFTLYELVKITSTISTTLPMMLQRPKLSTLTLITQRTCNSQILCVHITTPWIYTPMSFKMRMLRCLSVRYDLGGTQPSVIQNS
jgi:hypothetical protein